LAGGTPHIPVPFGCTMHFVLSGHLEDVEPDITTASGPSQIIDPARTAELLSS
jgi:hypothetical protein